MEANGARGYSEPFGAYAWQTCLSSTLRPFFAVVYSHSKRETPIDNSAACSAVFRCSCSPAVSLNAAPLDSRLAVLDPIINDAIAQQQIPGAVLIVGHDGRVVYRKAYGSRAIEPRREAMTLDTVFDCASLTKVVATTTAIMQLWEQGKFRMNDPVAKYLPEFAQNGKQDITIRQLLVHYSGLPEDLDLAKKWEGKDTAYRMAFEVAPERAPGSAFVYSDINFVVLGALVERLSGESLDEYAAKHVFAPLGMKETRFLASGFVAAAHRSDGRR